jgi:SNF2 family DNA or RNA helicase
MSYPYTRRPRPGQTRAMIRTWRRRRQLIWGDPGTGKTKIALDFIGTLIHHNKIKKALVVGPLRALIGTWEEQIEIDLPWLPYQIVRPKDDINWDLQFLLINYDFYRPRRKKKRSKRTGEILKDEFGGDRTYRDRETLEALIAWEPDVVVFDESHRIKNPYSANSRAAHKLSRVPQFLMLLTGTPKGNKKVLDLWSQFQAIQPGLLEDDYKEFKDHYCVWGGFEGREFKKFRHISELAKKIAPYTTRLKEGELPKQQDVPIRVDMTPRAKELYSQMERDFLVDVSEEYKRLKRAGKKAVISKIVQTPIILSKMIKLAQISGGFIRDEESKDIPLHTCKLEAMKEIMDDLKESGVKRCVIYARFLWELKKIREWLTDWVTFEISGQTKPDSVKLAMQIYNTSGGVMLCQSSTGAESLNFQKGNYELDYSIDHSYINYIQRRKRIHRPGQTKPCYYYQLMCKGTIDVDIYRFLKEGAEDDRLFSKLLEEMKRRHKL